MIGEMNSSANTASITRALLKAKASERKSVNTFATSNRILSMNNYTTLSLIPTNPIILLTTPMLLFSLPTCVFDVHNSTKWSQRPANRFSIHWNLGGDRKIINTSVAIRELC